MSTNSSARLPWVAILDDGHFGGRGGAGQAVARTIHALRGVLGEHCTLITPDGRRHRNTALPPVASSVAIRARRRLIREVQEHSCLPILRLLTGTYDVYHYIGMTVRPRVPNERLVISLHDLAGARWPDEMSCLAWAGKVLRQAARVTTVSEFSRRELCSYFGLPDTKVEVIYNGCDHEQFHPSPTASDANDVRSALGAVASAYILCSGGQTQRKNVARLLDAYARFHASSTRPPALVITGIDPASARGAQLGQAARDRGIAGSTVLPGYLKDEVMPALYRRAQAVVVPSLYEGFGLPVMQGMACGTPVLASHASSLPEVAGGAALLMDATSVEAMAAGLAGIVSDEPLRLRLREAGLARAATFTWERCARETIALYQDVAAQAAKRHHDSSPGCPAAEERHVS